MPDLPREPLRNTPLRPSDIKFAIYGRGGRAGLQFQRVLFAGWEFSPAPGIVAKDINRLGLDIRSFREPLAKAIKLVMMRSIRRNFEVGGRPEPGWEPLAEYTINVRGDAWPILVRSGALKRIASSFGIWSIGETSAAIKALPAKVWYGNIHQEGYGSIGMRARKILGQLATPKRVAALVEQLSRQAERGGRVSTFVIPQREFALFQTEDIEKIQEIFIEWMEDRADQVGRGWSVR
jgi:phage gpG-like protein